MKAIRITAALLMILSGAWHAALFFKTPGDPNSLPLLIFGILFLITGIVLYTLKKPGVYLGIVVPLVGMTLAIVKIGLKNFSISMSILVLMDIIVIAICLFLLLAKKENELPKP